MFKVINVRGNSVRVNSGLVTFDVQVITLSDGKNIIRKSKDIFISDRDMPRLVSAVLNAYNITVNKENTENGQQKVIN